MSPETFNNQHSVEAAGVTSERRALGTAERRTEQHPIEVKVFGDSRSAAKRAGAVHGVGVGSGVVWFAVIALVLAALPVSQGLVYKSGSGFGYYLGLVGGVMMLLMLLYPVRKNMRWARSWGPLRYWFMLHMVFGIGGPTLVLFHSTFHVKSLNAGVALYSMLLVAISGVIGRFIYKHIHHGLYGRQANLEELQQAVDSSQNKMNKVSGVLIEATGIGEKLKQFREMAFARDGGLAVRAWRFIALGWRRRNLAIHCREELRRAVIHLAKAQGWDKRQQDQHFQEVLLDVNGYLSAVQQAAQYTTYDRLMRLWHILHSPFVWLLAISGIVHVIAVNMY
jgi:hypothetical protein